MAAVTSLGVHVPSALDFCVNEGYLPPNHRPDQYHWQIYNGSDGSTANEEIFTTDACVVWSQGGVRRSLFRLNIEGESLTRALLTWFDVEEKTADFGLLHPSTGPERLVTSASQESGSTKSAPDIDHDVSHSIRTRALVVVLTSQAHVFLQDGGHHLVSLPFEVETVFPAPRGILLLRKLAPGLSDIASPTIPSVPPNSFFSPSGLQSPSRTWPTGVNGTTRQQLSPLKTKTGLSLEDFVVPTAPRPRDELPRIFALTDPLLPVSLVVETLPSTQSFAASINGQVEGFDTAAMSIDEDLLYFSPSDEISSRFSNQASSDRPLLLALSVNRAQNAYNVWYASYLEPKTAASWRRQVEESKIRSQNGAPYLRPPSGKDSTAGNGRRSRVSRASFAQSLQGQSSFQASQGSGHRVSDSFALEAAGGKESQTQKVQLTSPEKASVANRRTSSMLARSELTTHEQAGLSDWARQPKTTTGISSNRGPSAGHSAQGRRSFRASQASARASYPLPGIPGTNSDMDEDTILSMEADSSMQQAHGYEDFNMLDLQDPFDTVTRGIMMTKVCSIPMEHSWSEHQAADMMPAISDDMKVSTFMAFKPYPGAGGDDCRISVMVHHKALRVLSEIILPIQYLPIHGAEGHIVAPVMNDVLVRNMENVLDTIQIADGDFSRSLVLHSRNHAVGFYLRRDELGHLGALLPADGELSSNIASFFPLNLPDQINLDSANMVGNLSATRDRSSEPATLSMPGVTALQHSVSASCFNLVSAEGPAHCIQVRLRPKNHYVGRILDLCISVLPKLGKVILHIWWHISSTVCKSSQNREWQSLVVALLCPFLHVAATSSKRPETRAEMQNESPTITSGNFLRSVIWKKLASVHGDVADEASFLRECTLLARAYVNSVISSHGVSTKHDTRSVQTGSLAKLVIALQLLLEEERLNILSPEGSCASDSGLEGILAQLALYLGWQNWNRRFYHIEGGQVSAPHPSPCEPPSILAWLRVVQVGKTVHFPTLADLQTLTRNLDTHSNEYLSSQERLKSTSTALMPRTLALVQFMSKLTARTETSETPQGFAEGALLTLQMLETFPETIASVLRSKLVRYRANPSTSLPNSFLRLLGREDIISLKEATGNNGDLKSEVSACSVQTPTAAVL